jgi:hypothetical protein
MRALALPLAALFLASCDLGSPPVVSPDQALSLPTKDDVALVDGKALTIGAYMAIRETVTNKDRETILWLGLASLAIQNDSRSRGHELAPDIALNLAKFATGLLPRNLVANEIREYQGAKAVTPDAVTFKAELDALLARAVIHRNERALSDFR